MSEAGRVESRIIQSVCSTSSPHRVPIENLLGAAHVHSLSPDNCPHMNMQTLEDFLKKANGDTVLHPHGPVLS